MRINEDLNKDLSFGFLDKSQVSMRKYAPRLISNTFGERLLRTLHAELEIEGDDFYYLGLLKPESEFQDTTKNDNGESIDVVRMDLVLNVLIEFGLYRYLISK